MVTRAGLTAADFEAEFDTTEDCLVAAFDEGVSQLEWALRIAVKGEKRWLTRVRGGLLTMLRFLDAEPQWARLLVLQAPTAGAGVLERRSQALGRLGALLERGSPAATVNGGLALQRGLVAELVVGGVFSVIHGRMVKHEGMPLIDLAPSLMSLIALPYLGSQAANLELTRTFASKSGGSSVGALEAPVRATYRTALVLRAIAGAPDSSNREVAAAAGLGDEGQTSKLLSRLERQGLIRNVGLGHAYGEPNAWRVTASGRSMAELSLQPSAPHAQTSAAAPRSGRARCQGDPR